MKLLQSCIVLIVCILTKGMKSLKKWLYVLLLSILTLGLAACNDTAEPVEDASAEEESADEEENTEGTEVDEDEDEEDEEDEEENASELTVMEVYEEALKAAESLESTALTMNMEQEMTSPDGEENITTSIQSETEMTVDPLTMYQDMKTSAQMDGEDMDSNMEMYVTDEALYMYEEQLDEWIKLDSGMMGDINELANQEDPADQLKMFEQFVSDFDFEQTDDEFILKIDVDGDEFTSMMEEMVGDFMPPEIVEGMAEEGVDMFEHMKINHMYYEMYLDKETFDLTQFNMDMDMDLEIDDESVAIVQSIESTYSNINEIDPIEIPEEVEEAAIDESELEL